MPVIEAQALKKTYHTGEVDVEVLRGVDLDVGRGDEGRHHAEEDRAGADLPLVRPDGLPRHLPPPRQRRGGVHGGAEINGINGGSHDHRSR